MASGFADIIEEARLSAQALLEYGSNLFNPTVRLGVTGLSRAGKTVFITALVHGLLRGGRFPVFEPLSGGRIARSELEPQPTTRAALQLRKPRPHPDRGSPLADSTSDISELRIAVSYQRQNGAERKLTIDIVDYPGEWLLDLPLLDKSTSNGRRRASRCRARARAPRGRGMARASGDARRRRPAVR